MDRRGGVMGRRRGEEKGKKWKDRPERKSGEEEARAGGRGRSKREEEVAEGKEGKQQD